MREILVKRFGDVFDTYEGAKVFFAPGRINLIGEHTDYNGGHVFPCALTLGTYAVARRREDSIIRMFSSNFPDNGVIEFDIRSLEYRKYHEWANYPKGVIWSFSKSGYRIQEGMEVFFHGDIPNASGLSSSASIELVTAVLLCDLYGFDISMLDMVKCSKEAENSFIGVNCGIMDQFIIGMGRKDNAILLNTENLKYDYVRINLEDTSIVISNTNKRRGLGDSKYNERRSQCTMALKDLQRKLSIRSLGELTEEEFECYRHLIKDETCARRAKHAVYENRRTIRAVEALRNYDVKTFGRMMEESHISLRDDYEVTGVELDTLVELAWQQKGVIGSRMTGAGFGGCTVSIVKNEYIEDFMKSVGENYRRIIGYEANFYRVQIGDGARRLE